MESHASVKKEEQAIISVLESIALEEASLAALIRAETEKIKTLVACSGLTPGCYHSQELLAFQSSVKLLFRSVWSMQMLLLDKLERTLDYYVSACAMPDAPQKKARPQECQQSGHASELSDKVSETPWDTWDGGEIDPKEIATLQNFKLSGRARGTVTNSSDTFAQGTAGIEEVNLHLENGQLKENRLAYRVAAQGNVQRLTALPRALSVHYSIGEGRKQLIISGKGATDRSVSGHGVLSSDCSFTLSLCSVGSDAGHTFRMVILSEQNPVLNHDSGKVRYYGKLEAEINEVNEPHA